MLNKIIQKIKKKHTSNKTLNKNLNHPMIPNEIIEMTKKFSDHTLSFNTHNLNDGRNYIGKILYETNGWHREETTLVMDFLHNQGYLSDKSIAFDLGANIGTQTIYFALQKIFNRIYSIEADQSNFNLLTKNIKQNNLSDTVDATFIAIADYDGEVSLYCDNENQGAHSLIKQPSSKQINSVKCTHINSVKCKTLSTFIKQKNINFQYVDFIWSDLEGLDYPVFLQIKNIKLPKAYYLEFSPYIMKKDDTIQAAKDIFSCYKKIYRVSKHSLYPMTLDSVLSVKFQTDLLLSEPK